MKRKIISAILIFVLCFSFTLCAFAAENSAYTLVFDEAGLLTDAEVAELTEKLATISGAYGAQVTIMTVDSVDGNLDLFTEATYDGKGLGFGENRDGVMLLICMEPRQCRVLCNGFANEAINADSREIVIDAFIYDLSEGNYADAFHTYADQCEFYLDGYINGFSFPFGLALVVCFLVGLIIALIVTAILKAQLKSVRRQDRANSYVKGSLQLTNSSDLYLYRTVTRTKKETTNSSNSGRPSGGGSSRGISGRGF